MAEEMEGVPIKLGKAALNPTKGVIAGEKARLSHLKPNRSEFKAWLAEEHALVEEAYSHLIAKDLSKLEWVDRQDLFCQDY